jgi:hypothetical protein
MIYTVATDVGSRDVVERHTGALKALVHDLEQLALLGVHGARLPVVDSKELIVKVSDVLVEEVAAVAPGSRWLILIAMVAVDVEARVWHMALGAAALYEKVPQLWWVRDAAGQSASLFSSLSASVFITHAGPDCATHLCP